MHLPELRGRRAIITGASRGIGRAIALWLAGEGCHVAINYHSDQAAAHEVAALAREHGIETLVVGADVRNSHQVNEFVADVFDQWPRVDYLVNNAGILRRTPFLEIPEDEWDRLMETNVKGYFLVGQAVAERLVQQDGFAGAIVNISSGASFHPSKSGGHYNVSKASVTMLTQQMATELAPHGIRVNEVCPGLVVTDMNRVDVSDPAFRERRLAGIPLGKFGRTEDVAAAVAFLLSDSAAHITGVSLPVDGGSSM